MKRVSEIMDELGFRKDAPDSVKKAFLQNLIKQAEFRDHGRKNSFATTPKQEGAAPADSTISTARTAVGEDAKDGVLVVKQALAREWSIGPAQLAFDFDATGTDG